jgi:hypothetical protein
MAMKRSLSSARFFLSHVTTIEHELLRETCIKIISYYGTEVIYLGYSTG